MARERHTDLEVVCHIRQQTHGREFCRSDGEPTERQNKMDDVLFLIGGIIPEQDFELMKKAGVASN